MTSSVQIATAARACCDTLHEWLPTQAGNAHRVEARLGLGWERPTCKLIRSTGMRAFAVESFGCSYVSRGHDRSGAVCGGARHLGDFG